MRTFCLDSAGSHCLIVLGEGPKVIDSSTLPTREALSETILDEMQALLSRCQTCVDQIERFGVGIGPGGFTSLRVGIATIKGIAYAQQKPLVALGSLELLARSWSTGKIRLVLREAYRGEVYAAAYQVERNNYAELFAPVHGKPSDLAPMLNEFAKNPEAAVGGSGLERYRADWLAEWGKLSASLLKSSDDPSPAALLAATHDQFKHVGPSPLLALEPQYVRQADAALPRKAPFQQRPN